jgi:hypothetical protein
MSDKKHSTTMASGLFRAGREYFDSGSPSKSRADVAGLKSLRGVLRRLGEALDFPDWYGGNLDALVDCLCDPELSPGRSTPIAISGLATLQAHDPEGFSSLLAALGAATDERAAAGRPLAVLLDVAAPGLPMLPAA